ncbi:MAG: tRNA (5-methylaminomethyl-2-thiouridine)(34)-methyltransferase MnmD [Bacteroidales bacterium]
MKVEIIKTEDGSNSLFVPELDETYHSTYGALQEALHIFILNGLWEKKKEKSKIKILEIGLGTGLNALLVMSLVEELGIEVEYCGVEAFPVKDDIWTELNYADIVDHHQAGEFYKKLHLADWEKQQLLIPNFSVVKKNLDILNLGELKNDDNMSDFDLVFFDAFGPDIQPDLWRDEVFKNCFDLMSKGARLVTYSCKGVVRRAMKSAGFDVKKVPGPKGKREISIAIK